MKYVNKKNSIKDSKGDRIFGIVNGTLLLIVSFLLIYPIYFILVASISDPTYVSLGETFLLPKGITLTGYQKIIEFPSVTTGFINSAIYTVTGTFINLCMLMTTAYVLSRKELPGRTFFSIFFLIPMYFSGGLVPTYLQIKNLGLLNTMWALVLPGALNLHNMLVTRSFFNDSIPEELFEATKIDGGGYFTFFFKVALPLSKAIIAVMTLTSALIHWNSYMTALYYIRDASKYPLQMVLRNLTASLATSATQETVADASALAEEMKAAQSVRYAIIIIASIPVFLLYPFIQKYFVKGVMVGSVKG